MDNILVTILYHLLICQSLGKAMNQELLKDFLWQNHLQVCALLPCDRNLEQINPRFVISLQRDGFSVAMHKVSEKTASNIGDILAFRNAHVGVVTDLECPMQLHILSAASNLTLFHQNWSWLMFSSSVDEAYNILKGQNINVDAEVTVAVLDSSGNQ